MNRFMSSAAAIAVLGVGATLAPAAPANAAASHFNTNPYTTGCASNSFTISSRAVAGGTAYIKASRNCGTNWLEYRGAKQTTTKAGKDSSTNRWTHTEIDNVTVAVSMQSYAPGTTAYTGWIKIGNTTTTANCTYGCNWTVSTAPSSLSTKVDAFVAKWNGKYADYDGAYGAQCVDLAQFYNRDVVGAQFMSTPYSGGAKDIWSTYDRNRYTAVSAGSNPSKGDVAIWGGSQGGGYGHIAIVLADASGSVQTLTQNPGATRIGNITKAGLLGYLRPKM